jgi:glycerol-3-phosphate O-acyltransferase / dihydroxyacetone phosphate acyltransferase
MGGSMPEPPPGDGRPPEGPGAAYRLVRGLLRLVVSIFFRQVQVVGTGQIPAEGEAAVVFAGNHPNSLLDPVLVVTTCGRTVHFAAKDVLFRSRLLRVVLGALGAVPIRRRQDHGDGAVDNQPAFASLFALLLRGRAMGIFPEGLSQHQAQLARLKTGAAPAQSEGPLLAKAPER